MKKLFLSILILLFSSFHVWAADVRPDFYGFGGGWTPSDATYDPEIRIVTDLTCDGGALGASTRNGVSVKTGDFRSAFEELTQENDDCTGAGTPDACCTAADEGDCQGVIIIFETSGTIDCTGGDLRPRNPYTRIDGATAPAPGVMIKGETIYVYKDYQYLSHVRIRTGDQQASDEDGYKRNVIEIEADNVVIDHSSLSWSIDGIFGVGDYEYPAEDADNIDIFYSIMAEALRNPRQYDSSYENHCGAAESPPDEGCSPEADELDLDCAVGNGCTEPDHSTSILATYGTLDFSMIGNLLAHNERRNPSIDGSTVRAYIANNIIYNWKNGTMTIGTAAAQTTIGNLYIRGDDTDSGAARNPLVSTKDDGDWYALDNEQICDGACPKVTQWHETDGDDPCGLTGDDNQMRLYFDIDGYVGYHTSATPSATVLTDTDGLTGGLTGQVIQNLTDGSKCTITSSDGTTATCSGGLSGGSDNTWQQYDDYIVGTERRCTKEIDIATYTPIAVITDNGAALKTHIYNNVGAWPTARDSVDEELVNDFINGTGGTINSEMSRGGGRQAGWETLATNTTTHSDLPADPFTDGDSSGWDDIYDWLFNFLDIAELTEEEEAVSEEVILSTGDNASLATGSTITLDLER
jgi:hypothetical protein